MRPARRAAAPEAGAGAGAGGGSAGTPGEGGRRRGRRGSPGEWGHRRERKEGPPPRLARHKGVDHPAVDHMVSHVKHKPVYASLRKNRSNHSGISGQGRWLELCLTFSSRPPSGLLLLMGPPETQATTANEGGGHTGITCQNSARYAPLHFRVAVKSRNASHGAWTLQRCRLTAVCV